MSGSHARPFEPAPEVEGVTRRTVNVRTPDGITLVGTLRAPVDRPLPAPAVVLSPPGPRPERRQSASALRDRRSVARSSGGDQLPHESGRFGASEPDRRVRHLRGGDRDASPRRPRSTCFGAGLRRYHLTGELEYIPVVTPSGEGAFLAGIDPHPTEPFDYYGTERGAGDGFENRVTTISSHSIINFDYVTPAEFVGARAGLLFAGTDDVYVPLDGIEEVHRRLTGPKDLVVDGANHIDFYDNAPRVAQVTDGAVAWFAEHL